MLDWFVKTVELLGIICVIIPVVSITLFLTTNFKYLVSTEIQENPLMVSYFVSHFDEVTLENFFHQMGYYCLPGNEKNNMKMNFLFYEN